MSTGSQKDNKMSVVQYAPFASLVDPGFWHKLSAKKLNEYGLDESARHINGFYTNGKAFHDLASDYNVFE